MFVDPFSFEINIFFLPNNEVIKYALEARELKMPTFHLGRHFLNFWK